MSKKHFLEIIILKVRDYIIEFVDFPFFFKKSNKNKRNKNCYVSCNPRSTAAFPRIIPVEPPVFINSYFL